MPEAQKSSDIGMKRGRTLANLPASAQLDLIAEGLPILMKSAGDLLAAARSLEGHPRSASILLGHSLEEVAKILVLMDIVRCPPKIRPSRVGPMMQWFYDHLARLLYLDAQSWRPMHVRQLQEYLDDQRRSHYLGGSIGEYILPNSTLAGRESLLYADIITYEEGDPIWSEPSNHEPVFGFAGGNPRPWEVCCALRDFGAFTRAGLDVVSDVWSRLDFKDEVSATEADRLSHEMALALQTTGLITEQANEDQLGYLYRSWQLPMYRMDFKRIEVPLDELKDQRDANFWSEVGY
ncbi:hypothetical protein EOA50_29680 [Mesorhizobium sp. M1A.F.Ca.IN.020.30.1.1]|uniref:hypothetical protein n=1 Tax=Mesorhizobium sp. M1A.F.Ca.IN.020.30.1.1 TaxID=2496762 RepID=UPI000FD59604|nr:hypothetical protein [Mesorhizobium sp. M1A.F.Ca.IN.020.30.1.1]RUV67246.1 hypothetical protein EOA50_29680 [Mesorhizobium sp. M1A.F.Ca.IN.020.30.1.1]